MKKNYMGCALMEVEYEYTIILYKQNIIVLSSSKHKTNIEYEYLSYLTSVINNCCCK